MEELESSLDEYEIEEEPLTWRSAYNWIYGNYLSPAALKRRVPIIKWLPGYTKEDFACDLIAGLSVACALIPQAIGQALIAQLPITYGLYTALFGCLAYSVFGSCKDCNLGPTAIMALFSGLYYSKGGYNYVIILNLLSGLIQLTVGLLNMDFLVDLISFPVISSYINAASLVVIFSMVPSLFGLTLNGASDVLAISIYEFIIDFANFRTLDTMLGFISIFFILSLRFANEAVKKQEQMKQNIKVKGLHERSVSIEAGEMEKVPLMKRLAHDGRRKVKPILLCILHWATLSRNLIIVLICTLAAYLMRDSNPFLLAKPAPAGLPVFTPPNFTFIVNEDVNGDTFSHVMNFWEILKDLTPGWFVVPFLSALGAVSVPKVIEQSTLNPLSERLSRNQVKVKIFDPSQEIFTHGVGNLAGCCFQTMPMGLSFGRSFILHSSGVRTQFNTIITSFILLIAISPFCSPAFHYIPVASVAAVIICAIAPVMKPFDIFIVYRTNFVDFILYIVTFVSTVFIGIGYGILLGIGLNLIVLLTKVVRPSVKTKLGYIETSFQYESEIVNRPYLVVKPTQSVHYPTVDYLETLTVTRFAHLPEMTACAAAAVDSTSNTKLVVVIDGEHIFNYDTTFIVSTKNFAKALKKKRIKLIFHRMRHPIRVRMHEAFARDGLLFNHSKTKEGLMQNIDAAFEYSLPPKEKVTTFTQTSVSLDE